MFVTHYNKIAEEYELDLYISIILELLRLQPTNELAEISLLGILSQHKTECNNPDCPLCSNREFYLPATGTSLIASIDTINNPILVLHLVSSIYRVYVKISSFKAGLQIAYSHFFFDYMGNTHMAIIELYLAEKMSPSIQQYFAIYRSKRIIEEHLINKYGGKDSLDQENKSFQALDVTSVMQFEELHCKLYKVIDKSTNEYIDFWTQLNSLMPDLNLLHKLRLRIIEWNNQAERIWKGLYKIKPNYHTALKRYGTYLKEICNDEEAGGELLDKAKLLHNSDLSNQKMNDFSVMFAEGTGIVIIKAGNSEVQGKIARVNTEMPKLFKYNIVGVLY
jgi:hypothetical protein